VRDAIVENPLNIRKYIVLNIYYLEIALTGFRVVEVREIKKKTLRRKLKKWNIEKLAKDQESTIKTTHH